MGRTWSHSVPAGGNGGGRRLSRLSSSRLVMRTTVGVPPLPHRRCSERIRPPCEKRTLTQHYGYPNRVWNPAKSCNGGRELLANTQHFVQNSSGLLMTVTQTIENDGEIEAAEARAFAAPGNSSRLRLKSSPSRASAAIFAADKSQDDTGCVRQSRSVKRCSSSGTGWKCHSRPTLCDSNKPRSARLSRSVRAVW